MRSEKCTAGQEWSRARRARRLCGLQPCPMPSRLPERQEAACARRSGRRAGQTEDRGPARAGVDQNACVVTFLSAVRAVLRDDREFFRLCCNAGTHTFCCSGCFCEMIGAFCLGYDAEIYSARMGRHGNRADAAICRHALCAPHQERLQPRSFAGRLLVGRSLAGLRCARLPRGRRGACPRMGGFENETGLLPARVRPGISSGERSGSAPFRASRAGAARE